MAMLHIGREGSVSQSSVTSGDLPAQTGSQILGGKNVGCLIVPNPQFLPTPTKSSENLATPSSHLWWQISPKRQASRIRQTGPPHLAFLPVPSNLKTLRLR